MNIKKQTKKNAGKPTHVIRADFALELVFVSSQQTYDLVDLVSLFTCIIAIGNKEN